MKLIKKDFFLIEFATSTIVETFLGAETSLPNGVSRAKWEQKTQRNVLQFRNRCLLNVARQQQRFLRFCSDKQFWTIFQNFSSVKKEKVELKNPIFGAHPSLKLVLNNFECKCSINCNRKL